MKRLYVLLLSLLLLTGCARPREADAVPALAVRVLSMFPPAYDLAFRLEAFEGEEKTSYSRIAAVRTADGFYYHTSTGEEYLFLLQGPDAYALYTRDGGRMVHNRDVQLSGAMVDRFQDSLLHLGLLVHDTAGLTPAGEAEVDGRPCLVYEEQAPAGPRFTCRRTYHVDADTGLTLYHSIRYRENTGRTFTYVLTCERFRTEDVSLPEVTVEL